MLNTIEQDTIYQYVDGRDLLQATLTERGELLQKLEALTKAYQENGSSEMVVEFPLMHAQTLLFEVAVTSESIHTLIVEINRYANQCDKPRVQVTREKPGLHFMGTE